MPHSFTPGPWRAEFPDEISVRDADGGRIAILANLKGRLGMKGRRDTSEVEANARLIAAAPDLLEALQWYEAKAVQMGRAAIHQDSKLMLALMKEMAVEYGAKARAAIARATGEQP